MSAIHLGTGEVNPLSADTTGGFRSLLLSHTQAALHVASGSPELELTHCPAVQTNRSDLGGVQIWSQSCFEPPLASGTHWPPKHL